MSSFGPPKPRSGRRTSISATKNSNKKASASSLRDRTSSDEESDSEDGMPSWASLSRKSEIDKSTAQAQEDEDLLGEPLAVSNSTNEADSNPTADFLAATLQMNGDDEEDDVAAAPWQQAPSSQKSTSRKRGMTASQQRTRAGVPPAWEVKSQQRPQQQRSEKVPVRSQRSEKMPSWSALSARSQAQADTNTYTTTSSSSRRPAAGKAPPSKRSVKRPQQVVPSSRVSLKARVPSHKVATSSSSSRNGGGSAKMAVPHWAMLSRKSQEQEDMDHMERMLAGDADSSDDNSDDEQQLGNNEASNMVQLQMTIQHMHVQLHEAQGAIQDRERELHQLATLLDQARTKASESNQGSSARCAELEAALRSAADDFMKATEERDAARVLAENYKQVATRAEAEKKQLQERVDALEEEINNSNRSSSRAAADDGVPSWSQLSRKSAVAANTNTVESEADALLAKWSRKNPATAAANDDDDNNDNVPSWALLSTKSRGRSRTPAQQQQMSPRVVSSTPQQKKTYQTGGMHGVLEDARRRPREYLLNAGLDTSIDGVDLVHYNHHHVAAAVATVRSRHSSSPSAFRSPAVKKAHATMGTPPVLTHSRNGTPLSGCNSNNKMTIMRASSSPARRSIEGKFSPRKPFRMTIPRATVNCTFGTGH